MKELRRKQSSAVSRHTPDEDGFSLVELLVTMMIFIVLAVMIGGMLISVTKTTTQGRLIDGDTRAASNGMNELSRMIRAATENPLLNPASGVYPNEAAVQAADVRTITLYAYVNLASSAETPLKVMFWVNGKNQLIETKWLGTTLVNGHWTFSTTSTGDRILADNVVASSAIFGFQTGDGTSINVPSGGIVSNTTLLSIRFITVSVSIKSPLSRANPVIIQNTIGMPNLGFTSSSAATS
jgi:type II secretory pathway pseudopilin PulG